MSLLLFYSGSSSPPPSILYFDRELANFIGSILSIAAYPNRLPSAKTSYPLLSYTVVAGDPIVILSGACSLAWVRIQLDCYSTRASEVEVLAEQLRRLFQDFAGPMGAITVKNCIAHQPRTSYTPSVNASDSGIHRFRRDFQFWFSQT
jgi:hypothetical protein